MENLVPNFLSASSPQGLRRLMFQFASGKWWAWYYEKVADTISNPKKVEE
jgi:hypothetical protein